MQNRRKVKTLDSTALLNYALQSLGARAMSSSELRTRLKQRAENVEDVEPVLGKLKDLGYLNDRRFAESFANWRKDNQGFGKTRVMRDLMARKVAPAVAQQAAQDAFQDVDEVAMIERYLERKYRGKNLGQLLQEEKHLASAFRKLRAAGFSVGASIRVLKRYAAQAEELESMDEGEERSPDA